MRTLQGVATEFLKVIDLIRMIHSMAGRGERSKPIRAAWSKLPEVRVHPMVRGKSC